MSRSENDTRSQMESFKEFARAALNEEDVEAVAKDFNTQDIEVLLETNNDVIRKFAEEYDPKIYTGTDDPHDADVWVLEFTQEQADKIRTALRSRFNNHADFMTLWHMHESTWYDITAEYDDVGRKGNRPFKPFDELEPNPNVRAFALAV